MKKNFDEDKFLIMREALSKDSCNQLTNAFEKFKKTHSMFKLDGNPNNFSVTNSHRLQCDCIPMNFIIIHKKILIK